MYVAVIDSIFFLCGTIISTFEKSVLHHQCKMHRAKIASTSIRTGYLCTMAFHERSINEKK